MFCFDKAAMTDTSLGTSPGNCYRLFVLLNIIHETVNSEMEQDRMLNP